jgi:preprotein translocase subunit SecF
MNLMKYRLLYLGIFAVIIVASIVSWSVMGLNRGVDFEGGTDIRFPLSQKVTTPQVVEALSTPELDELNLKLAAPQPYDYVDSQGNQRFGVLVHTRFLNNAEQKLVISALENSFGAVDGNGGELDVYGVDPLIGNEMLGNAFLALILACVLILVYIAIRFEFKSGVAGIVAIIHDVLAVVGIFALLQKQVDASFVAAILTIVGYSINDTIVVFDRIRENLKFRRKGETIDEVVNTSILQTIRRSLNTSITTVLAILVLYLVGSPSIKEFCLALIIGLTAGTYSSVFVASPLWAAWKNWEDRRKMSSKPLAAGTK